MNSSLGSMYPTSFEYQVEEDAEEGCSQQYADQLRSAYKH